MVNISSEVKTLFDGGVLSHGFESNSKALQTYNIATELFQKGKFLESTTQCDQAIKLDPNFAYSYNLKGLLQVRLGDSQGAIDSYKKAIELDPNMAVAHHNLGHTLENLGHLKEAAIAYGKAIGLNPNAFETFFALGMVLMKVRPPEWISARNAFERVTELRPDYEGARLLFRRIDEHIQMTSSAETAEEPRVPNKGKPRARTKPPNHMPTA